MRFVVFTHSLRSDWNHGNAHFLGGVLSELQSRGHALAAFEPEGSWSARNLVQEQGAPSLADFSRRWPGLPVHVHGPGPLALDRALEGADGVVVHEWNEPDLREALVDGGLRTVHARHTCAHRVDGLLALCARLDGAATTKAVAP